VKNGLAHTRHKAELRWCVCVCVCVSHCCVCVCGFAFVCCGGCGAVLLSGRVQSGPLLLFKFVEFLLQLVGLGVTA
jgi:hypothetical protein